MMVYADIISAEAGSRGPGEGPTPQAILWVHASAVVIGEAGVLIRGASGTGKSRLSRRLVERAQAEGLFGRVVGDDRIGLTAVGGRLLARPHPAIAGLVESRGRGLLRTPYEPVAAVRCVIDLVPGHPGRGELPRLPEPAQQAVELQSLVLPRLTMPGWGENGGLAAEAMAFIRENGLRQDVSPQNGACQLPGNAQDCGPCVRPGRGPPAPEAERESGAREDRRIL